MFRVKKTLIFQLTYVPEYFISQHDLLFCLENTVSRVKATPLKYISLSTLFKSGTDFLCTTGAFQLLKGRFTTLTGQDLNFHPRLGLLSCP